MRKIVASVFVSLDGVMQAPGGPEEDPTGGFRHGGWAATHWDDEIEAAMGELFSDALRPPARAQDLRHLRRALALCGDGPLRVRVSTS